MFETFALVATFAESFHSIKCDLCVQIVSDDEFHNETLKEC